MGVPKFFKFIIKKYKNKFIFQKENTDMEIINWLLLDTNCLIHPVCFKILDQEKEKEIINFKSLENKMMNAVIKYIEKLVEYVKPNHGFFIAIDGPVCAAKIKQQRQRRFRSVHDKVIFDKIKTKYKKKISFYWNNSSISPGTKFMEKLHWKILNWLTDYKLKCKLKIIYSSVYTPGEGEHKLLDFIKNNDSKLTYCTYGLDADLIFLMLTQPNSIYLLREAQQFEKTTVEDQLNFVNMNILKDCIYNTFNDIAEHTLDKNRIINDFIFLCYFLGNDFLPHIISLDIAHNGIQYLILNYIKSYNEVLDYILSKDTKIINHTFLSNFLSKLGNEENAILIKNFSNIKKQKNYNSDPYERELFKVENLLFNIKDNIGIGVNSDYRNNYYKINFNIKDDEIEEFVKNLVNEYLIGIRWVSYYYFQKIPDWSWFYKYDYPPFLSDISKYLINMNKITFKLNKSYMLKPLEQLLTILPKQASYLLPQQLTNIPEISHLQPLQINIDFLYKHRYWEGVTLLPILDIKLIKNIFKIYCKKLKKHDLILNRIEEEFIL
jgi:5'-3' exonuclease